MPRRLKRSAMQAVENIIAKAANNGRNTLFEHEVYQILAQLGMDTPPHILVKDEEDISARTLSIFRSTRIVLKAAAADLTHKQKAGGVRVVHRDLDFVKFAVHQMKVSMAAQGYDVEGILLVEFIEYAKDLGNEVLLGFRESDAFGPVISFSKGGGDAEHFAAHFSPPNLILAPIDRKWAQALLESTKLQKKYVAEGNTDYIPKIVDAGVKFSRLATHYSSFFQTDTRFVIKEFEVNPFIFDPTGNFIALDGFARFAKRADEPMDLDVMPKDTLRPFFEPEGVAVVGVSALDDTKTGNTIARNLVNMQRQDIYGVNIKGGTTEIAGETFPLYPSILDIDAPIDLAVITTPAESTLPLVEECAQKGVKAIILIPGGFSEIRENADLERKILTVARHHAMRIIGPNCLGIIYAGNRNVRGINTFFVSEKKFHLNLERNKNVAILSQSGALGITEIYNLRNAISPKVIVSYGNQLDVDPGDLVNYFDTDPMIDVMACYIEGFKKGAGRKFFNTAAKSRKPVIVYKAGRTAAGKKATQSHTASIAGEYEVAKAAMKQAGLIVADTMIDHGDFIKTFALLNDFKVAGNRVVVVANAGYEKALAADNLGELVVADLDRETIHALERILPPFVNADPFLDLTPMAGDAMFEQCIEIVLKSDRVDALFVSIVPHGDGLHTTDEEIDRNKENLAARIVRIVHKYKKPTTVSVNVVSGADAVYNKFGQIFDSGGVPTFLTAKRAMDCLNAFIRYKLTKKTKAISEWLK